MKEENFSEKNFNEISSKDRYPIGSKEFFQSQFFPLLSIENFQEIKTDIKEYVLILASDFEKELGEEKVQEMVDMVEKVASSVNKEAIRLSEKGKIEMLIERVSGSLSEYFEKISQPDELEDMLRNSIISNEGVIHINEVVYCTLSYKKDELRINIHQSKTIPKKKWRTLFEEGLREIASLLKNNDEYKGVKEIVGDSWIVEEHPRLVRRFGFETTGSFASVSRDNFLCFVEEKLEKKE